MLKAAGGAKNNIQGMAQARLMLTTWATFQNFLYIPQLQSEQSPSFFHPLITYNIVFNFIVWLFFCVFVFFFFLSDLFYYELSS